MSDYRSTLDPRADSMVQQNQIDVLTARVAVLEASGGVQLEHASLSSAQIKALNTTPITFLAAVPGKTIIPVSAFLRYTFVSADYSFPGSTGLFWNNTGTIADVNNNGSNPIVDIRSIMSGGIGESIYGPATIGEAGRSAAICKTYRLWFTPRKMTQRRATALSISISGISCFDRTSASSLVAPNRIQGCDG